MYRYRFIFKKIITLSKTNFILHITANRLFLYVHHDGQFLLPGRTSFKLEDSRPIKHLSVRITGTELIPDGTNVCNADIDVYDSCTYNEWNSINATCMLPFLRGNKTTCSNYEEGTSAMKKISSHDTECSLPCIEFETSLRESSISILTADVDRYKEDIGLNARYNGYFIHLPNSLPYFKSSQTYDPTSYIAEFAGWASLFLGISFVGCLRVTLHNVLPKNSFQKISVKRIMLLTHFFCIAVIIYITVILFSKLIDNRLSTSIHLKETNIDFDLTMCTTKTIRELHNFGLKSTIKETHTNWRKVESKLAMLTIKTPDGVWDILNVTSKISARLTNINMPLTNGTIDFCHTVDLSGFNKIEKINLVVLSEIKFFLHYPGQFIYNWKNWINTISSVTKQSFHKPMLYGSDITFKVDKSAQDGMNLKIDFDKCFLKYILSNKKLNMGYKQLIQSTDAGNISEGIDLEQQYIAVKLIEQGENICQVPTKIIIADFSVKKERHKYINIYCYFITQKVLRYT